LCRSEKCPLCCELRDADLRRFESTHASVKVSKYQSKKGQVHTFLFIAALIVTTVGFKFLHWPIVGS
jgi:hypothetical protein